jgi:hypothetical protein
MKPWLKKSSERRMDMPSKKSFKDDVSPAMNPAMQFISGTEAEAAPPPPQGAAPAGYKLNPLYVETKSDRMHLLVQPSLRARLKERAAKDGVSVNELANSFMEAGLRGGEA